MGRQYDVYDDHGHRIGYAEEQPSGADTLLGIAIIGGLIGWLAWVLRKPLGIALLALLVIGTPIALVNFFQTEAHNSEVRSQNETAGAGVATRFAAALNDLRGSFPTV